MVVPKSRHNHLENKNYKNEKLTDTLFVGISMN